MLAEWAFDLILSAGMGWMFWRLLNDDDWKDAL